MKIFTFVLSTIMMLAASTGITAADKIIAQELAMDVMLPDDVERTEFTAPQQMYLEICAKKAHNKYFGSRAGEFDIDMMEVVKTEEYIIEEADDADKKSAPSFMRTMAVSEGKCKLPCPQYPKNRYLKKKKKNTKEAKKLQKKANTMFCDCVRESPFPVLKKAELCRLVFKDAVSLGNTKTIGDDRDGDNE